MKPDLLKILGLDQEELDDLVHETWMRIRQKSLPLVDALLQAGWRYELPEIVNRKDGDPPSTLDSEPWQWYWRSPPKRKGSKGRKYWSTQQAYNALLKITNSK